MAVVRLGTQTLVTPTSSPFDLENSWDEIRVAGKLWPPEISSHDYAKFTIKGAKRAYKWDIQEGFGVQGCVEVYRGWTPQPFSIEFFLWDSELYRAWADFQPVFQYDGTKRITQQPINISHPMLANLAIRQVIVEDIGAIEMVDASARMFSVTVSLREFFPPRKIIAAAPADAASTGDPNKPKNTPIDQALIDENARLTATLAAQAGTTNPTPPQTIPFDKLPFSQ